MGPGVFARASRPGHQGHQPHNDDEEEEDDDEVEDKDKDDNNNIYKSITALRLDRDMGYYNRFMKSFKKLIFY